MGSEKRERQKARSQAKRDEVAKIAEREAWRQRLLLFLVIGALLLGGLFLLTQATNDGDEAADSTTTTEATTTSTTDESTSTSATEAGEIPELVPPPPGASIDGPTPCPEEDGSSERTTQFSEPPPMCIDTDATYTAVMSTDAGDITIELDPSRAPNTVNNFVVLARYHYYEGVPFHRIIPDFVVQGGDAVGEPLGIGGPGYSFGDELPEEGEYEIGSLAMANSGPDTNGSQFFIVTGPNGAGLPPQYSLFGQVTDGFDVVEALDALGSEGAGKPTAKVTITGVTITEG